MDIAFAHTLHILMSEGAMSRPTLTDADLDVTPRTCTCTTRRHILDTPASEGLIFLLLYFLIITVDAFLYWLLMALTGLDASSAQGGRYYRGLQDDAFGGYTYVIG